MEQAPIPDIFISYSRKDIAFARLIRESLITSGFNIWIDWERIPTGVEWWKTIEKVIQESNTFLFIVSKTSITSPVCKDEINTALRSNKRIIPVIVDNLSPEAVGEFIPDLRKINWILFQRDRIFHIELNPEVESDKPEDREVALPGLPQFEQALKKLSLEIQTDWEWVTYHTRLQTGALTWEEGQRDASHLLGGVQLEEAERRLLAAAGKNPQPTLLQTQFISTSRQEEDLKHRDIIPDIFISYSRKDIAFARLIRESLITSGFNIWIDWERIPTGVEWWKTIEKAIQESNTFLFIISKTSITSPVCKDEINTALRNNKRIIPVIVDKLSPEAVGEFIPDLRKINWILFQRDRIFHIELNPEVDSDKPEDREVALPGLPQFEQVLKKLSLEIQTDWEWVTYHTRLQTGALTWEEGQRDASFLLRGVQLEEAERRLLAAAGKDPQPTLLQTQFISTSRQEEALRQQEIIRNQEERLAIEKKSNRRQKLLTLAISGGLAIAIVLSGLFLNQRNIARSETSARATAEAVAIDQRNIAQDQARTALSRQLAAQSDNLLSRDHWELASLLAIEAGQTKDTGQAFEALRKAETHPWITEWYQQDHPLGINDVVWSRDETRLLSSGCDTTEQKDQAVMTNCSVNLWDVTTGTKILQIIGFHSAVEDVQFSPDESKILTISGGNESTMQLWDAATGKTLFTFGSKLNRAIWPSSGNTIHTWSLSADQTVQLWNAENGQEISKVTNVVARHSNGSQVLVKSTTDNRHMVVVDPAAGEQRFEVEGIDGDWSEDGALLVTYSCKAENCEKWTTDVMKVWDASTGKSITTITPYAYFIESAAWSHNASQIVTLGCDAPAETNNPTFCGKMSAKIWDARTGKLVRTFNANIQNAQWQFTWNQNDRLILTSGCDDISNSGRSAVCTANSVRLWDVDTGEALWTISGPDTARWSQDEQRILTFNRDSTSWLREEGDVIKIWDANTGAEIDTFAGHSDLIQYAAWSVDRTKIISAGRDGEHRLWSIKDPSNISETSSGPITYIDPNLRQEPYPVWDPDHTKVITLVDNKIITVWDERTGAALFSFSPYAQKADGVLWNSDGTKIISFGCTNGAEVSCQAYEVNVWDGKSGEQQMVLTGFTEKVEQGLWSPDEGRILTLDRAGQLLIWNASTGENQFSFADNNARVDRVFWSVDGKKLIAYTHDKQVRVWNVETWAEQLALPQIEISFPTDPWSPDFSRVISFNNVKDDAKIQYTGQLDIFELETGKRTTTITVEGFINNISWIPNTNLIQMNVKIGEQFERQVIDTSSGKPIKELDHISLTLQPDRNRYFAIRCDRLENKKCLGSTTTLVDILSPAQSITLSETLLNTRFVSWNKKGDRFLTVGETEDINIWDAATGKILITLRLPKRSGTMLAMNEAGNSNQVVETTVQKAAWSPDDTSIVSLDCYVSPNPGQACNSGAVRVWDAAAGLEYFSVPGQDFEWSADGERILVSDGSSIKQWYVNISDVIGSVCDLMPRRLSDQEWKLYMGDAEIRDTCSTMVQN